MNSATVSSQKRAESDNFMRKMKEELIKVKEETRWCGATETTSIF